MFALLFLLCVLPFSSYAERGDICRLFKDGTQLRKPGSCSAYITCQNSTSVVSECGSNFLYDVKRSSCVSEALMSSDRYCSNNCEGKDNYWVADLTSCHGFYYCSAGVGLKGFCADGFHFDEEQQMCIHDIDSPCIEVYDICQVAPTNVKFRNEGNCNSYYECKTVKTTIELKRVNCKSHEYFHVQSGTCLKKHEVMCEVHPIPNNVCGTDGKPKSNMFVSDQATCRGYFYCADLGYVADLEPTWGQCPEGTFFNEGIGKCGEAHQTPCMYNRCEGRGTRLVESPTNDCHNYWVCKDGMPVEERTCFGNLFFNSPLEACVSDIIYYPSCDHCTLNKC